MTYNNYIDILKR